MSWTKDMQLQGERVWMVVSFSMFDRYELTDGVNEGIICLSRGVLSRFGSSMTMVGGFLFFFFIRQGSLSYAVVFQKAVTRPLF